MCLKLLCQYPLRMCIAYFRHVLIVIGAEKQGLFIFLMSGFPSECTMKLWCTIKWHWYALWTCKSNPFCENQAIRRHNVWAWLQSTYSFRSRMQVLLPHTDIREVRRSKKTFLILGHLRWDVDSWKKGAAARLLFHLSYRRRFLTSFC